MMANNNLTPSPPSSPARGEEENSSNLSPAYRRQAPEEMSKIGKEIGQKMEVSELEM
jgi:hypothetical protein